MNLTDILINCIKAVCECPINVMYISSGMKTGTPTNSMYHPTTTVSTSQFSSDIREKRNCAQIKKSKERD